MAKLNEKTKVITLNDNDAIVVVLEDSSTARIHLDNLLNLIKVSGRNIARNTKLQEAAWWWVGTAMPTTVDIKMGDKVLLSWSVTSRQAGGASIYITSAWGDDANRKLICSSGAYTNNRASYIWTAEKDWPKGSVFNVGGSPDVLTSISEFMFELNATIASDWTPAPEDMINP